MLGNSGDELVGRVNHKILLVFALLHFTGMINDVSGFLDVGDILHVEDISHYILGNGFGAVLILLFNSHSIIDTESRVFPRREFTYEIGGDLPFFFQELEQFRPKQFFKGFQIHLPHHIKSAGVFEKSIGNKGMEVRMPFCRVGSKRVYGHDDARDTVLQSDNLSQKGQQTSVGALAESGLQRAVVLEIDPKHDGNGKNILPVGNRVKDIFRQMMTEDDRSFSLA